MTASAIYTGTIRHRRFAERERAFDHGVAMAYVDLWELPNLLGGRLVARRPGLVRFRREDYFGNGPLDSAVRQELWQRLGWVPDGPIRVLTHLRSFGHCFNPVSFYYCFDRDERLRALMAEVTNTPWGERKTYVLEGGDRILRGESEKAMHVSPFMGMNQTYDWRVAEPSETLSVHIENWEAGTKAFDATLSLKREELSGASLARATARYPAATLRILALIYAHAAAVRLSGIRAHPHPVRAR